MLEEDTFTFWGTRSKVYTKMALVFNSSLQLGPKCLVLDFFLLIMKDSLNVTCIFVNFNPKIQTIVHMYYSVLSGKKIFNILFF